MRSWCAARSLRPLRRAMAPRSASFLPSRAASWHGALSTANTGAALSSTNLPAPASRGLVQQADQFRWFTRDRLEIGGPLTRWADFYASGSGQWASQTEPLAAPGTDQRSRLLFGNARGRVRASDQRPVRCAVQRLANRSLGRRRTRGPRSIDRQPHGAVFRSAGRIPRRTRRPTILIFFRWAGRTFCPRPPVWALIEVRYGYSTAHLDTSTAADRAEPHRAFGRHGHRSAAAGESGRPHAPRDRSGVAAGLCCAPLGTRHQIVAGGGWKTSEPRNRFTTPSDMNLITADGAPAFVMEFNTPLDSRELVRSFSAYRRGPCEPDAFAVARSGRLRRFLARIASGAIQPGRSLRARADLRRATGSDRVEQPVAARRFRVAGSSFARPGSSGNILSLVCAAGGQVSRLRKSEQPRRERISMDRVQSQRLVSTRRTRQSAAALRRTLLVHLASASAALLG